MSHLWILLVALRGCFSCVANLMSLLFLSNFKSPLNVYFIGKLRKIKAPSQFSYLLVYYTRCILSPYSSLKWACQRNTVTWWKPIQLFLLITMHLKFNGMLPSKLPTSKSIVYKSPSKAPNLPMNSYPTNILITPISGFLVFLVGLSFVLLINTRWISSPKLVFFLVMGLFTWATSALTPKWAAHTMIRRNDSLSQQFCNLNRICCIHKLYF